MTYTLDGTYVTVQGDKHDALPRAVYDSRWHDKLMGWLVSLTLEDEVRHDLSLPRVIFFITRMFFQMNYLDYIHIGM